MNQDRYKSAVDAINAIHDSDPNTELFEGGVISVERLYSNRIVKCLQEIYPEASEELMLAGHCQHLGRWEVDRSTYPKGKIGYYQWRNFLGEYQSEKAKKLLHAAGYDETTVNEVVEILKKVNIHRLEDAQKLEDAVCLVFLHYYMEPFIEGKSQEHLIQIVQKTWNKMSEKAHTEALKIDLPNNTKQIVSKALA